MRFPEEVVKRQEEILRLKRENDVYVMAHYYQRPEVQAIADVVGDSLELSREAAQVSSHTILFCGVYFMAEVAKVLAPSKKVLIPYPQAGCLLADMALPDEVERAKMEHPGAKVVAYVNTTAATKALADVICTSANAGKIMGAVDSDQVIFLPDMHLGTYHAMHGINKKVHIWDGYCPVHKRITRESIERVLKVHPDAHVVVHPEVSPDVSEMAHFVGSTSQLVRHIAASAHHKFIVGTEEGTLFKIREAAPEKELLLPDPVPVCDQMKMITLDRVLRSLQEGCYEVEVDPDIASGARVAIERMLELS